MREHALALLVLAAASVPSMGCATKPSRAEIGGAEARIRKIRFEGMTRFSEKELESYLNHRQTEWFPLPDRQYLYEGLLAVDARRIEETYEAFGYPDARVVDVRVEPRPRKRKKLVDVVFVVEENRPVLVTDVRFDWPDGAPHPPRDDRRATIPAIEKHSRMRVGKPLSEDELEKTAATLREALRARGFAFAEVTPRAEVDLDAYEARVSYSLHPGPFVRIGNVRIEGLQEVPKSHVQAEARFVEDRPFSPHRLRLLEEAIYALGVFNSVTVEHGDAPGPDGRVDLVVRVVESLPQSIKIGVGLGLEPNRWEQRASLRYTHSNLFRRLVQLELRAKVGYAELPAVWNPREHGPLAELTPELRWRGWLDRKLTYSVRPSIELGIQEGYQFWGPSTRVGVSRFFWRLFELQLSHNFRYIDFFNISSVLEENRTILGLDFRDPYVLSFVELGGFVHLTDRVLAPRNGVVLGAIYDVAGGPFGGDFDYHKVLPEVRGYLTPIRRLQFALRLRTGFIFPYGDQPGAPFDLKLYLGGSDTVRGWGLRRLSPVVTDCDVDGDCRSVPVGGRTMVMGNFEIRGNVYKGLWVVAFVDGGDVQPGIAEFHPRQWNYSAGPGLRYDTRIGKFRLDLGFRLNDPERFDSQPIWALHFGLGEAF
jgi:outer membrane protein assembly factor BamA